ncbi:hypothetical protein MRX96_023686 [Rhipicephalus microplus]
MQCATLGVDHRGVVRHLFGLPRSSPIGPTLAEAVQTLLSLRAKGAALRHLHRMHRTPEGRRFAARLLDRPHSGMVERALEYRALVPQPPDCGTLPILPHHDPDLAISTTIPGIRTKRNNPQCVPPTRDGSSH